MTERHAFDPLLLSQVRLGIVTVLLGKDEASFSDLKAVLGLTQGNLGVHLRKLKDAGYVAVVKDSVDRRPRTSATLTPRGRAAILEHVSRLGRIVDEAG